jgi:uncharacterized protein YecE (DUF72 family)
MSAEERLKFYAAEFPIVEVDATYYFPPTEKLAGTWVERTPADFTFDIKAYSLLTQHPTKLTSLWPEVAAELPDEHRAKKNVYLHHLPDTAQDDAWERFRRALMPLHSAGKLGVVLFQFGPWFRPRKDNRDFLRALPDRLPDYDLAVEFRHGSWMASDDDRARTLDLLEKARLAFVSVDEPQGFATSVPPVVATTADIAVVRFHGRNAETWDAKNITPAERFKYLYSDTEVADELAPRVRELASSARETHALFNNCYADYGIRNARHLADLL